MSESETGNGKRTVSRLTASQIQHKRDLDRKAQRAMRQRTKLRIQELENDIARYRDSVSRREQTMIDEIQLLRNQNRQLKYCLEKIGQDALQGLSGVGERVSQDIARESCTNESEPQPDQAALGVQSAPSHPIRSEYDVFGSNQTTGNFSTAARVESNWPVLPPLGNAFAGHSRDPHLRETNSNPLTPLNNLPQSPHDSVTTPSGPRLVAGVLPKHSRATCPLDQILLDFIASRRSMLARGVSPAEVLGPEQLCPRDLLNPTTTSNSHAISRVMADVLTTFPHVKLPEKMAFMYIMHLTTRWQISPNVDSYARMPLWLRPTVQQITVPHPAWIDNIPWPRVRDILIQEPDRYPFPVFSELYSEHIRVNWPYDTEDIVIDTDDEPSLNTIFEKHIQRLGNWVAPRQFREYFSEWTSDVYIDE